MAHANGRHLSTSLIVGFGWLLILPETSAASDCDAFAKYGIYDTRESKSIAEKADSFRSWFCQSNFSSKSDADSAGGKAGYANYSLGYDQSKESWSQFYSNYCSDQSASSSYHKATLDYVQNINTNASNNMLACFVRPGFHVRLIPGSDPQNFSIFAVYNPSGTVSNATLTSFLVQGAVCTGPLATGKLVTASGGEDLCKRTGKEPVLLSVSATEAPIWDSPQGLAAVKPVAHPSPVSSYKLTMLRNR